MQEEVARGVVEYWGYSNPGRMQARASSSCRPWFEQGCWLLALLQSFHIAVLEQCIYLLFHCVGISLFFLTEINDFFRTEKRISEINVHIELVILTPTSDTLKTLSGKFVSVLSDRDCGDLLLPGLCSCCFVLQPSSSFQADLAQIGLRANPASS